MDVGQDGVVERALWHGVRCWDCVYRLPVVVYESGMNVPDCDDVYMSLRVCDIEV